MKRIYTEREERRTGWRMWWLYIRIRMYA